MLVLVENGVTFVVDAPVPHSRISSLALNVTLPCALVVFPDTVIVPVNVFDTKSFASIPVPDTTYVYEALPTPVVDSVNVTSSPSYMAVLLEDIV